MSRHHPFNSPDSQRYLVHAIGVAGILVIVLLRMLLGEVPWERLAKIPSPDAAPTPAAPSPTAQAVSASDSAVTDTSPKRKAVAPPAAFPKPKLPPKKEMDTVAVRIYTPAQPELLDLNTADSTDLVRLYGIGAYFARRILERRQQLGGFVAVEQLLEIKGIDTERLSGFYQRVKADSTHVRKIHLQTAEEDSLAAHPYIGRHIARNIMLFRKLMGSDSCNLSSLVRENILTKEQAEKLEDYIHK